MQRLSHKETTVSEGVPALAVHIHRVVSVQGVCVDKHSLACMAHLLVPYTVKYGTSKCAIEGSTLLYNNVSCIMTAETII